MVAGDRQSATAAGLVAELRGNDAAKKALSTVDDAGSALGNLTVALTVAGRAGRPEGQLRGGRRAPTRCCPACRAEPSGPASPARSCYCELPWIAG